MLKVLCHYVCAVRGQPHYTCMHMGPVPDLFLFIYFFFLHVSYMSYPYDSPDFGA